MSSVAAVADVNGMVNPFFACRRTNHLYRVAAF